MSRRLALALAASLVPVLARTAAPAASTGTACTNLAALTIPNVTIKSSTLVPAGPFSPPGAQPIVDGQPQRAPAPMTLPAFCRVEATARPSSDSEIKFEVWIPPVEAWNGKFQGVGNGGYQGSISYAAMATALRRGYATASTDTGHAGDDMKFGQGHPEKLIDYGYRAVHVMTESAKLIIRDAAGRFADKSYFVGCSAGGQQALSEAQRYPDDYDGIIAGDPASNRIRQTFGFLSSWIATHTPDGKPVIGQPKLALLTKAVVDACDTIDGLKDGLIDDPRACDFKPASLRCRAGDGADCLTAAEVGVLEKWYAGARDSKGRQLYPGGIPLGSEPFWPLWLTGFRSEGVV